MKATLRVILAPAAEEDIASILTWTAETFGTTARRRYARLLVQAIDDLASAPTRTGVHRRPEVGDRLWTYHLVHSRTHVGPKEDRVATPRHFVMFRLRADGGIEVVRILHDSMDLARHRPSQGTD